MFVGKTQGFLVKNCDDANKPADIRSEVMRKKTQVYFTETLFTRLNRSDVPVINVQQRLHLDDLSGFLAETYNFVTFKFPLLDPDGKCNLPRQYNEKRIAELQLDNYVFSAQYQQEPIILGGGVFHHDWWRYYNDITDARYKQIFITADTASKTKEWNDYTAIGVWGLTLQNKLRLLDFIHDRFEMPELEKVFKELWMKWQRGVGTCRCSAIYIEDKASGTGVIQSLRRIGGLPIMPLTPDKDKLTRALDAVPFIASGNVELPHNDKDPMSREILKDLDAFSADMSHLHDDSVDCLVYAVQVCSTTRGYF